MIDHDSLVQSTSNSPSTDESHVLFSSIPFRLLVPFQTTFPGHGCTPSALRGQPRCQRKWPFATPSAHLGPPLCTLRRRFRWNLGLLSPAGAQMRINRTHAPSVSSFLASAPCHHITIPASSLCLVSNSLYPQLPASSPGGLSRLADVDGASSVD